MEWPRQTKIIAPLGPATATSEAISSLIEAGANIFRLNMSHARHDWAATVVGHIRQSAAGRPIAILADLQGPAIRTGTVEPSFQLEAGQSFVFYTDERPPGPQSVSVNYPGLANDLNPGDTILIDNGLIRMKVLAEAEGTIECEVLVGGEMGSRRHINLPGVKVNLPALTQKDHADIECVLGLGVDFIALSFVREAGDIAQLRDAIANVDNPPRIIAKIEDQHAVQHLDPILKATDAIMIARGDLGIECSYEELPIIQRRIAKLCQQRGCPVIVATHMLESMIEKPHPTRAEVTDVANAVYEHADAIMLSGETSVGKFPDTCVEVADRIARRIERSGGANYHQSAQLDDTREKLAHSAVRMADDLDAAALVVFTREGRMVPEAAWMRPRRASILALCLNEPVARAFALHRAVQPVVLPWDEGDPDEVTDFALAELAKREILKTGDTVVVISSELAVESIADSIQMRTV
ncbi:MAG: pyruvate kinase [Verrucomicrobiales bacterium]|nr:pyruvate kinase [Verrucomicrobiales bacterium]